MGAYSKFVVAVIMAFVAWLRAAYDIDVGLDESTVTALVGAVTALLVYAVPNKARE